MTLVRNLGMPKGAITARTSKGEAFSLPKETPAQTRRRINSLVAQHGDITLEDGSDAILTISADGSSSITDSKSQFAIDVAESKGRSLFEAAVLSSGGAVDFTFDGAGRLQK